MDQISNRKRYYLALRKIVEQGRCACGSQTGDPQIRFKDGHLLTCPIKIAEKALGEGSSFREKLDKEIKVSDEKDQLGVEIKYPNVKVNLTGVNGNAFAILGECEKAAKKAGLTKEQIDEFLKEAMSDDYDHLLQTCMKWFDCD